jgi:drug/metabolite transporter (DMT)-like permease
MSFRSSRYMPFLALMALPLIWGYTWVPMKIAVSYSGPFTFAALRTLPGGLLLLAVVAVLRHPVRPKAVGLTMLLGLLQTSGFTGFTIAALVTGGAGRTAILANTWQFWILLMAWVALGERLRGTQWISVALALGGLMLIIEPWKLHGILSPLLALAGAVSFAASSIVAKFIHRDHKVDLLSLTAWQTLFGSIPLVLLAVFLERGLPDWTPAFSLSLAYTLLAGTGLAAFLWLFALKRLPAGIAGLGTMGTPVVGLLTSWAQLGERPTGMEVVGMVLILVGLAILFVRTSRNGASARSSGPPTIPSPGQAAEDTA